MEGFWGEWGLFSREPANNSWEEGGRRGKKCWTEQQGNPGLKTVKFKLKGQDTTQVLPPLSLPRLSSSSVPIPTSSLGVSLG